MPVGKKKIIGLVVLLAVLPCLYLLKENIVIALNNVRVDRQISELQAEKARLEDDQLELMNLISNLSSEYYLEKEGRVKQGLGREGETLVIVQNEGDDGGEDTEVATDLNPKEINNPTRWFYYFFDRDKFQRLRTSL